MSPEPLPQPQHSAATHHPGCPPTPRHSALTPSLVRRTSIWMRAGVRLQRGRSGRELHAPQFRRMGADTHMKWKPRLETTVLYDLNALYEDPQVSVLLYPLPVVCGHGDGVPGPPETWRAEAAVGAGILTSCACSLLELGPGHAAPTQHPDPRGGPNCSPTLETS